MRAVLIPAEGDPREVDLPDGDSYQALRDLVGGPIEGLGVGRDDAHAFGNDEAKIVNRELPDGSWVEGLAPNSVASALVYGEQEAARERGREAIAEYEAMGFEVIRSPMHDDPREPYVAGDVVVCGVDPRTGSTVAIPDDLAASILGDRS